MAEIHFDATKSKGVTQSTEGHEIYYQVYDVSGLDDGQDFQVEYETNVDFNPQQEQLTFKQGTETIELKGHIFYLDNVT
ncbi:hypothetical protein [Halobacillus sp. B29]|uniref:hypothetical protein n=1 Tax=Halobacillus sp. B29 TaxID=3457432 RepID=UPI003FCC39F9